MVHFSSVSVIESPCAFPEELMSRDAALLSVLSKEDLIVHLYDWRGACATYGHFVDPQQYFQLDQVHQAGLKLARRPTGGGVLFHTCDYAFSVLIGKDNPAYRENTLQSYELVNQWTATIIEEVFQITPEISVTGCCQSTTVLSRFCMAKPTQYDLTVQGRKVGGAAQRRTKQGLLHQGSICLTLPPQQYLQSVVTEGTLLSEAMRANSHPLLGWTPSQAEIDEARRKIRLAILAGCYKPA